MLQLLEEGLAAYAEAYTTPETDELKSLNRETHAKVLMPQMLSGHVQGTLLRTFSFMIRPKAILEVGTYTGYSAINMAMGLQEGGKLHTIDINEELEDMIRRYINQSGVGDKIQLHIGNALDIIPRLNETFDLVFIDADKVNYAKYYDLVFDKVSTGGFIIADNVLWSGKVLDDKKDKDTQAIHDYNEKIHADERVENILLPVRDGLMVARKIV